MHKLFPLAILAGLLAFVVVPAHAAPQLQVGGDGRTIAVGVKDGEQGAPASVDSPGSPSGETTHQRVIALPTSDGDVEGFKSRGCDVTHRLSIGTGLNCPQAVAKQLLDSGQASVDQLLRVHDLESDTYILADQVWSSYTGTGIRVAVLDTGVQADHAELASSIIASKNFVLGGGSDTAGHGTHVIGIITGDGVNEITNNFGFASPNRAKGAAPDGGILSGKVCGTSGCFQSDIISGIDWAIANGAKVINLSLGGGNYGSHCDGADPLVDRVNLAVDQGVVVTVSAGNGNAGVSSPACASKAIAVGAVYQRNIGGQSYQACTDPTSAPDQRTCFSNSGPALDLMAPGATVLSSYSCHAVGDCSSTWYAWMWGTSQAAPHVAAAAALVLQADPSLTPAAVKGILQDTARDAGAVGRDDAYGWGITDVKAALDAASPPSNDPPTVSITSPADGSIHASGALIVFGATATDTEDGDLTAGLMWSSSIEGGPVLLGGSFSFTLSDGVHTITAFVTDSGGKTGSDSITITVGSP